MSIWDDHYDALYGEFGKDAVLTLAGFSDPVGVTAIPKIGGVAVDPLGDKRLSGSSVEIQTIRPAADVRVSELSATGVSRSDMRGGTISLAGKVWRIDATLPKPSPEGEANGELRLVLIETSGSA